MDKRKKVILYFILTVISLFIELIIVSYINYTFKIKMEIFHILLILLILAFFNLILKRNE